MEKSTIKIIMSDILRFFIKRVCILYLVLMGVCFLSTNQRISMMVALTLGVLFSLVRFGLLEWVITYLNSSVKKTITIVASIMIYVFGLLIVGITAIFALNFGVYTFLAALVGSFAVVIITMINAITEALGITKNRFGEKVI